MSKKGKDDEGSVSPPTSPYFDQAILIRGPVTPCLQNPTEVENENQVKIKVNFLLFVLHWSQSFKSFFKRKISANVWGIEYILLI